MDNTCEVPLRSCRAARCWETGKGFKQEHSFNEKGKR